MTKYTLWKVKPGKRQTWEDWCGRVMSEHQKEAIVTLIEEDLIRESCVLFGSGDESYVLYKHTTKEGCEKKPMNLDRELNRIHKQLLSECLEKVELTPGYALKVPSEE